MDSGYGGDGWWLSGSHVSPIFLPYKHVYKSKIKIFYDTMKYKKINAGIFNFYASTVNISLLVFTLYKNYFHGA